MLRPKPEIWICCIHSISWPDDQHATSHLHLNNIWNTGVGGLMPLPVLMVYFWISQIWTRTLTRRTVGRRSTDTVDYWVSIEFALLIKTNIMSPNSITCLSQKKKNVHWSLVGSYEFNIWVKQWTSSITVQWNQ